MILQFSQYRNEIIRYMFDKYPDIISFVGISKHMLFSNIRNDIIVYIKALKEKEILTPEFITFDRLLESYRLMYQNNKNDININSRLFGVIHLFKEISKQHILIMPQFSEFEKHFKQMYKVQDDNKILEKAMDKLCWDCYTRFQWL